MTACRWCGAPAVEVMLDLGPQPPADLFPFPDDPVGRTPLRLGRCAECGLSQLLEDPGVVEEPRGIEPQALVDQAHEAVGRLAADGLVRRDTTYVEFGSPHGGSWRDQLHAAGAVEARPDERADLVIDVFGLMHEADQRAGLQRRIDRLANRGTLLLQYQPLRGIVDGRQWNAVRHGHFAYYDGPVLADMTDAIGLVTEHTWNFPLYGLTTLQSATRDASRAAPTQTGVAPAELRHLADQARSASTDLRQWLTEQRRLGYRVIGYAAASRTVPLLNYADVGPELLPTVLDGSDAKWGRVIPGVGIPIGDPEQLRTDPPDVVVLFVPDLLDEVRTRYPEVEASGGRWARADPTIRLAPVALGM